MITDFWNKFHGNDAVGAMAVDDAGVVPSTRKFYFLFFLIFSLLICIFQAPTMPVDNVDMSAGVDNAFDDGGLEYFDESEVPVAPARMSSVPLPPQDIVMGPVLPQGTFFFICLFFLR